MLDHYINGVCNRISPEAPIPIVEVTKETYTLGGAGNVLQNIFSLGVKADIVSILGNDDNAQIIFDTLKEYDINKRGLIVDASRCTTIKSRVLVTNHQLVRLDRENRLPINAVIQTEVLSFLKASITNYDLVLISDYEKGLLTPELILEIVKICKTHKVRTIVDPKGVDFTKYKGVNLIKPNKKEASLATGIAIIDQESLHTACVKIKELTNCDDVIITMSEDGMALYTNDQLKIVPTRSLSVVDVTGAGDTVLSALGVAIMSKQTIEDACNFANHAAAVVVSKVGSAVATLTEIEENFKKYSEY